jgi:predicted dehydrogenase
VAKRVGVGFVGDGFIAHFHAKSWVSVRDGDIVAVTSRIPEKGEQFSQVCRDLEVGNPAVYTDVRKMVQQSDVDVVYILAPNYLRLSIVEAIVEEIKMGRSRVRAIALEKPLARNVQEAKAIVELIEESDLLHGYLENQVFMPSVTRGKELIWKRGAPIAGSPYLARASEEHSGPHRPWFWQGSLQGGGSLSDLMCHSVEANRYLLSPADDKDYLRPVAVNASIASLKWSLPKYAELLKKSTAGEVDYTRFASEDYASAEVVYETKRGDLVISQVNTSWSYVGPGLRITFELLGPEYSLAVNTLEPEAKIFFGREVTGPAGEDLVEKQSAEQGQMPFLGDEAHVYGYTAENQHMINAFAKGIMPRETLHDGLLVVRLLMAAYKSAELGQAVRFTDDGFDDVIPLVQQDKWHPRQLVERAK